MNKKTMVIMLLSVFLVSVLAVSAEAAFKDALDNVFKSIESFFTGGWKAYEKALAFFLVFFLFFSSFLIGAKKAFGEISKPVILFCFAAAAISGGILVVTNKFTLVQFGYVAFGLLFLMVTSAFYAMLMKLGLENHKFAAFFIAFFITSTIFLVGYLLSQKGGPLSFGGDVFGWLNDVTASFKGKGSADAGAPAKGDFLPEGKQPVKVEKGWFAGTWDKFDKSSTGTKMSMGMVLLAILALTIFTKVNADRNKRKRAKEDEERRRSEQPPQEQPLPFGRLLEILEHYLKKKGEVMRQIGEYKKESVEFNAGFYSLKVEIIKKNGIDFFQKEYSPWLRSGEGSEGPEASRLKIWKNVPKLHRASAEFVGHLREFAVVEHFLPIRAGQVMEFIKGAKVSQQWTNEVGESVKQLRDSSRAVSKDLSETYKIARNEEHTEEEILEQLKPEHLKDRTSVQWLLKEGNLEEILGKLIEKERSDMERLEGGITSEADLLRELIESLRKKADQIKAAEEKRPGEGQPVSGTVTLPDGIKDRTENLSFPL